MKIKLMTTVLAASMAFCGAAMAQDEGANEAAASNNKGGLFVEPMLTYEVMDSDINFPSPLNTSQGDIEGIGLGARLGFHASEAIFVGADVRYSLAKFKNSAASYEADAKAYNWGPTIGFQMPEYGLRILGTYVAGGEMDPDADGSIDAKFKKGTGYRVGAGLRVKSFSVNLEYQELTFDETQLEKIGPFSPSDAFGSVELEQKGWIASVSFPVEL